MASEKGKLLTVHEEDTVDIVLQKLHESNILSAPVVNSRGQCKKGFFAIDDVVMHLARIASLPIRSSENHSESNSIKEDQLQDLIIRQHYFHQETVHDIISRHRGDKKFLAVDINRPLSEVLHIFAHGVQRVCVTKNRNIVGILSQSTVTKWLAVDTARLGQVEEEPAEELGIPWKKLLKIPRDMHTIDAIMLIHDRGVHCAPIIDSDGKLIAHFSMNDIKALALNDIEFKDLILPIFEFISRVRQAHNQPPNRIVGANRNVPFKEIIKVLAGEHVHQAYLLESDGTPVSMISLTDVCQKIFQHSPSLDRKITTRPRRLST